MDYRNEYIKKRKYEAKMAAIEAALKNCETELKDLERFFRGQDFELYADDKYDGKAFLERLIVMCQQEWNTMKRKKGRKCRASKAV